MPINLLPPHAKANNRFEMLHRRIMFFGEVAALMASIFAIALLLEIFFANTKLNEMNLRISVSSSREEVRGITKFQQDLRMFKKDIDRMSRIQLQHPLMHDEIAHVSSVLPDGIVLTQLDVDLQAKNILLSGVSPTRERLLALKEALEKDERYAEIHLPLANLLKEKNIPFTFSLALMSEKSETVK